MSYLSRVIDFILPPRCIVTGEMVDKQGMISPAVWGRLNFISSPYCDCCGFPFDYDVEGVSDGSLCAKCLKYPPKFDKARAALIYDDASRDIVLGYKHGDQTYAVPTFIPWLERAGADIFDGIDYIMPVPLHPLRLLRRRFNQAGLIAQYLAKELRITCLVDGLKRVRATPTQGHLEKAERKRNVRNAFRMRDKYIPDLKGKNILLIDDVFTTGATINECTKELRRHDVNEVRVLTLARVIKPIRL